MNNMIEFAKNNRTTGYFLHYVIVEIRVAYRIMEYLAPDSAFKPRDLNEKTKHYIFSGSHSEAIERIIDHEIEYYDLGSSSGYESLREQGVELIRYLLPIYEKDVTDAKEKRRIELLKELQELDVKEEL